MASTRRATTDELSAGYSVKEVLGVNFIPSSEPEPLTHSAGPCHCQGEHVRAPEANNDPGAAFSSAADTGISEITLGVPRVALPEGIPSATSPVAKPARLATAMIRTRSLRTAI